MNDYWIPFNCDLVLMAGQFTQWDLCKECNVISIYGSGHFATVLNDIKSVLATIKESVFALIIDTFYSFVNKATERNVFISRREYIDFFWNLFFFSIFKRFFLFHTNWHMNNGLFSIEGHSVVEKFIIFCQYSNTGRLEQLWFILML